MKNKNELEPGCVIVMALIVLGTVLFTAGIIQLVKWLF